MIVGRTPDRLNTSSRKQNKQKKRRFLLVYKYQHASNQSYAALMVPAVSGSLVTRVSTRVGVHDPACLFQQVGVMDVSVVGAPHAQGANERTPSPTTAF